MIALLLAAQLSAQSPLTNPHAEVFDPPSQARAGDIIRTLPAKGACLTNPPGHVEVSLKTTPTALYRHGDRPAKGYLGWADYPDPVLCAVEGGR